MNHIALVLTARCLADMAGKPFVRPSGKYLGSLTTCFSSKPTVGEVSASPA